MTNHKIFILGKRGARWPIGLLSKRSWVRNLPPPCCVLEQDKFTPQKVIPRKRWLHTDMTEKCFSLLFGKCVNWSIDKTIYSSCHYIQSNDSLTALDANNSWLPHYHKYMYWFFKCTGKCTDIEGVSNIFNPNYTSLLLYLHF